MLSAAFFGVFLIASIALFSSKSGGKSDSSKGGIFRGGSPDGGLVGIVEVKGVILDSKKTLARLRSFGKNEDIKAVVVRVNSPGGSVAPSQEVYEAIKGFEKKYEKPLAVSMGAVAASGGLYLALGAKKVFANPGTMTGSIGVIMEFVNLQGLYNWAKVKRFSIRSGNYKGTGASYRTMTAGEKQILQRMIENVLDQFKNAIAEGRKLKPNQVKKIADGRIFSGEQAKEVGLVDELGTLGDAVAYVAKEAKIEGEPEMVYARKRRRDFVMEYLLDRRGDEEESRVSGLIGRIADYFVGAPTEESETISSAFRSPGLYLIWDGYF